MKPTEENVSKMRSYRGFPRGGTDVLVELSSPPAYTCFPNPWLSEAIDGSMKPIKYHKTPYISDVREGKHHAVYTAHSYHTKTPHRAIMRYILHYTSPGDVVLDLFSGSGMTGVASSLCGSNNEVRELGYTVRRDGRVVDRDGNECSSVGKRRAILVELSPSASFVSRSQNFPPETEIHEEWASFFEELKQRFGLYYQTLHQPTVSDIESAVSNLRGETRGSESSKIGQINVSGQQNPSIHPERRCHRLNAYGTYI